MFADEKVLVTGAAGLIGSHLVWRLAEAGANVRAVIHSRRPGAEVPGVDYLRADLKHPDDCAAAVAGCRYVFHCAASTSGAYTTAATPMVHVTPNVIMNALLLEAAHAAHVEKLLWLSSTVGYPEADRPVREHEFFAGEPFDKYFFAGWAKRFGEVLCRMYGDKLANGMATIVLRPTNVYGPGDKFDPARSHVTAALIRKVLERQNPIEVWGTGDDVRDLIYVDDFVEAALLAMSRLTTFTPLNIGSGQGHSVKQVLQTILELEGWNDANVVFDPSKPTMIPVRLVDTTLAEQLIGFQARTSLRDGLARTIEWYRQETRIEGRGSRIDEFEAARSSILHPPSSILAFRPGGRMNEAIAIGLVQINNSFSGQNYLPYSAGLLQACVQKDAAAPARYRFLLPVYKRLPVARAVEQLLEADVVAFSAYVWNVRLSLAIARELKRLKPETLIVFGGPQVPDRGEPFVRQHPYIDLAVHGEGETAFRLLLEEYPRGRWEDVPGLSFVRPDGTYVSTPRAPRISKLDTLPSPYLEGVFDPLMAAQPEEQWLALWETNRGCPFSCTFCDWGSATAAKVYQFDLPRLYEEIDWFARQRIEFVFCCDANFGMLPRDLELARRAVQVRVRTGYPQALSVQNTKNATERAYQVQKTLADAGLNKGVTLSLQTVDAASLAAIKRQNISSGFYQELQSRFSADGIETYTDMILGLPEETYDSFVNGIAHIVGNGQHNRIQFNNLSILPNAEMGDPAYQQRHGLQLVSTRIINIHGSLAVDADDVQEYQELVVGTRTLTAEDWRRTRALCWMTSFLYFDKVLQIPLLLLHKLGGLPFRDLIELFTEGDLTRYPTLTAARTFFLDKARDIQQGGEEYCRSEQWLNIWWPADELLLIQLCTEARLWDFYEEAHELLADFLKRQGRRDVLDLLADAVALNRALLKLPFHESDLELELGHNVWALYQAARHGEDLPAEKGSFTHRIERTAVRYETWADWCRLVVWYGNKKGAYLYAGTVAEKELRIRPVELRVRPNELEGHF